MTEIHWEEPPPELARQGWIVGYVEGLKMAQGKWALVVSPDGMEDHPPSTITRFRKLGCETRSTGKGQPQGRIRLWARWPADG